MMCVHEIRWEESDFIQKRADGRKLLKIRNPLATVGWAAVIDRACPTRSMRTGLAWL
jgi:hypothetical protein